MLILLSRFAFNFNSRRYTEVISNRLVRVQVVQARGFIESKYSTDAESTN
jgi:hypothetical protein